MNYILKLVVIGAIFGFAKSQIQLLKTNFNNDARGMSFERDAFFGTHQPLFSNGIYGLNAGVGSSGGLKIELGGSSDNTKRSISGAFVTDIVITESGFVTLDLSYNLILRGGHRSAFYCALYAQLGRANAPVEVDLLRGGGSYLRTGWTEKTVDLGYLDVGVHHFAVGAYNNKFKGSEKYCQAFLDNFQMTEEPFSTMAPTPSPTMTIPEIIADFNTDVNGFVYKKDVFGTASPALAKGIRVETGGYNSTGALAVNLTSRTSGALINGVSGGWTSRLTTTEPTVVRLDLLYRIEGRFRYKNRCGIFAQLGDDVKMIREVRGYGIHKMVDVNWTVVTVHFHIDQVGNHAFTIGAKQTSFKGKSMFCTLSIDELSLREPGPTLSPTTATPTTSFAPSTAYPTSVPSTAIPTTNPTTVEPTVTPGTTEPTSVPGTLTPSASPNTTEPTQISSTAEPTAPPVTAKPTAEPTAEPTSHPSAEPTAEPNTVGAASTPTTANPTTKANTAKPTTSTMTGAPTASTIKAEPTSIPSTTVQPTSTPTAAEVPTAFPITNTSDGSTAMPSTAEPTSMPNTAMPSLTASTSEPTPALNATTTTGRPTATGSTARPTATPSTEGKTTAIPTVEGSTAAPSIAQPTFMPSTTTPSAATPSTSEPTAALNSTSNTGRPSATPSTARPTATPSTSHPAAATPPTSGPTAALGTNTTTTTAAPSAEGEPTAIPTAMTARGSTSTPSTATPSTLITLQPTRTPTTATPTTFPSTETPTAAPTHIPTRSPVTDAPVTEAPTGPMPARICPEEVGPTKGFSVCLDMKVYPEDVEVFSSAADTWSSKIRGNLRGVPLGSYTNLLDHGCNGFPATLDDLYLCGLYEAIDGPFKVLGEAGPWYVRGNKLPITGRMRFDSADINRLRHAGTLSDVILHEMAHILGVGSLWPYLGLTNANTCKYLGENANREWQELSGCAGGSVPVELDGGAGTRCAHWDEVCLGNEIMTGYIGNNSTKFSKITIGGLQDLGYRVADYDAASDDFTIDDVNPSCLCNTDRNLRGGGQGDNRSSNRSWRQRRRRLSDEGLAIATAYGKEQLLKAKEEHEKTLSPTSSPTQTSSPTATEDDGSVLIDLLGDGDGDDDLYFVGDKVVTVYYYEAGEIYDVEVTSEDLSVSG